MRYLNFQARKAHGGLGIINDPLGQLTVPASSDCSLIVKFWDGRTDNLCEIMITTCRDPGQSRGSIFLDRKLPTQIFSNVDV